jgi:hypothetical protein
MSGDESETTAWPNEVQELKQHIRWLRGQAEWEGGIGETVD